jgi:flagellar L-ring protein precursor FlgH
VLRRLGVLFCALLLVTAPVSATSLWSDAAPTATMFADRKARMVGDTITILIEEETTAEHRAGTNTAKGTEVDMGAGSGPILKAITSAGANYSDKYASSGTTTRSNSLTAKITAQVMEVKPNGNLVISGSQSIKINGEDQKITVTGTVRPDDIGPDNSILSTSLADAQIKVDGKGAIGSKQKPGIINRLFGWLF